MLTVESHLIIDRFLIGLNLVLGIAVIPSVFRNAKMFNVRNMFTLADDEIRSIWFSGKEDIIWIHRFVLIIDPIQIQEVGDLNLLIGPHHLALNRYCFLRPGIDDLLFEVI